jgi:hypothetical protein
VHCYYFPNSTHVTASHYASSMHAKVGSWTKWVHCLGCYAGVQNAANQILQVPDGCYVFQIRQLDKWDGGTLRPSHCTWVHSPARSQLAPSPWLPLAAWIGGKLVAVGVVTDWKIFVGTVFKYLVVSYYVTVFIMLHASSTMHQLCVLVVLANHA